ncbi:MAG: hypothetical protein HOB79_03865 [Rhodospirillaceae bacterium]|jgi:hypothetical protein|nr:hypothetical protein [Rhodospirillales bacterium]MBT3906262.1 hypothetical protein [Rhodospirillaceae bacterium]MBT4700187.1 hypothetical protein [Rhodospirillaceae bacterium]MBT5033923.1 hypothetical protein [Rhodospirillaceae bacterium]MBT6220465.1 hypothetical protein [Rhodospirillaceae bacterium]
MNRISITVLIGLLFTPGFAGADQIDGDWCTKEGRRLNIEGPKIRTPGGTVMTGEYDRHNFAYVVPKGEPGAGVKITMEQLDDDIMHMRQGDGSKPKEWNRCRMPIS